MRNVDICSESIKILGVFHFSYNEELADEKNVCAIVKKRKILLNTGRWGNCL